MKTSDLEEFADTHSGIGHYQVPTDYEEKQRWLEARREFRERTGHDPRPSYLRDWPHYE